MPTYDYVCEKCDYRFEEFQAISAPPLTKCPRCRGSVKRLIGGGNGFLFKGNGFYTTDYRSDSYKKDKQKSETTVSESKSDKPSSATNKEAPSNSLTQNSAKTSEK